MKTSGAGVGREPPAALYLRRARSTAPYNDLDNPRMGASARASAQRAGRPTFPEASRRLLEPSPRLVSRELLTREPFIPATTLNLLAGAWLQFEVHDWFSHGENQGGAVGGPLAEGDDWGEGPMRIPRTRRDPTSDDDPTDAADLHDRRQPLVGRVADLRQRRGFADAIRPGEGGKLRIDEQGLLPADLDEHVDLEGVAGNFWVGLGMLHTLFTLEHNAICDALRKEDRLVATTVFDRRGS